MFSLASLGYNIFQIIVFDDFGCYVEYWSDIL